MKKTARSVISLLAIFSIILGANIIPDKWSLTEAYYYPATEIRLNIPEAEGNKCFGKSVSIFGDTAVVGAPDEYDPTGAVYIYSRDGNAWFLQTTLKPDDLATRYLGRSVSIYGDTVVAAAQGKSGDTAYVFTRSGSIWSKQAQLSVEFPGISCQWVVSIYGDTIVVGAIAEKQMTGAVYIFTRSGSEWTLQQRLTADDSAANNFFGYSVAISQDTLVVGATAQNNYTGAAYVFMRTDNKWTQLQ